MREMRARHSFAALNSEREAEISSCIVAVRCSVGSNARLPTLNSAAEKGDLALRKLIAGQMGEKDFQPLILQRAELTNK